MESLPIINKIYEIYKGIVEVNHALTKRWCYSLGLSLENSVLDCMENLVMAKNAPRPLKAGYLIRASGKLEISTLKLRLMLEMKLVGETKIFQIQAMLAETGRMLGGWLRSAHNQ